MTHYSARAEELAQQLGEKAAGNLRRAGRSVSRDASTGRWVVASKSKKSVAAVHKHEGSSAASKTAGRTVSRKH